MLGVSSRGGDGAAEAVPEGLTRKVRWDPWCCWTTFRPPAGGPKISLRLHIYTERRWRKICGELGRETGLESGYNSSDHSCYPVLWPMAEHPEYPDGFHQLSAHRVSQLGLVLIIECFPGGPPWLEKE